jgi:hypothetical protein
MLPAGNPFFEFSNRAMGRLRLIDSRVPPHATFCEAAQGCGARSRQLHCLGPEERIMTTASLARPVVGAVEPVAIPVEDVLPWAIFGGLVLMLALYFVGAEQGATSLFSGTYVHEFVHDGRHLLGFPCH